MFEFENANQQTIFVNKTVEVKTSIIEELGVQFVQNNNKAAPEKYQVADGYPVEFSALNTNENPYLHI